MIVHWIVDGVSGSDDTGYRSTLATNRYRAILPALGMRDLGHTVRLIDMADWAPEAYPSSERPHAVVIGKLLGGPRFESLRNRVSEGMRAARRLGIALVSDINDDHFQHPILGPHWKAMVTEVDAVVAGSESMAEVVRRHGGRAVFVVSDPVSAPLGEPHVFHGVSGWRSGLVRALSAMGYASPRLGAVFPRE